MSGPPEPPGGGSSPAASEDNSRGKSVRLLKSGFGQSGRYAFVTAFIKNKAESNVGRFVTVQFNLRDSAGEILASTDHVEAFSRPDQTLAVGTQVDIPDSGKVAKVQASLNISDDPNLDAEPFPEIRTGKVKVVKSEYSEYGDRVGRVRVKNPTDKALTSPRVSVICLDAKGRVIGGGSAYLELIPPSGRLLQEVTLITSGRIERCNAYAVPGL